MGQDFFSPVGYLESDKLSGVSLFGETDNQSYPSVGQNSSYGLVNRLTVTVTKNQGSANGLFGYNFLGKGEGLSLTLQCQVSRPGVYHVVVTQLARVHEGCNLKTLGDVLNNQQIGYPMYYLSNDVLATIEYNTLKSLSIARLPNFDQLQDLAGRGLATTKSYKFKQQQQETKMYPSRETNDKTFRGNKLPIDESDDLDIFVQPSTAIPVTYEPDIKLRPKAHIGPVIYF
ncbi:hypothetical protein Btru_029433 [Bulinus truncatus]|nr:hypothetical protein Btru_029433 [Bulinus truncatus]